MFSQKILLTLCCFSITFFVACKNDETVALVVNKGDHIVIIGNTFAERLQNYNYLEPLLFRSFPAFNLTVRNMGWSGDEVNLQLRPLNFGSLDERLAEQKPDLIIACFGMNEAFKGPDSINNFRQQLSTFLLHLTKQHYNGSKSPRLVLVSPIAHEKLGGFLPEPDAHNKNLALYTETMAKVAGELKIPFINLFEPTRKMMASPDSLTINGIHLNNYGYQLVSQEMAKALRLPVSAWSTDPSYTDLKMAIDEKNRHFFYKFRAVNGEYIYGRRKEPWVQPPGSILSYPTEMKALDSMVAQLDTIIWQGITSTTGIDKLKLQHTISYSQQSEPRVPIPASVDQFKIKDGYRIELFASEMDFPIEKPVKITFDPKGRMWVATMPSYPQYYPGSPPNDKIVILEDTNHDGKADKHTVFADSLYMPLGFELGNGGAYVTQSPNLVFLKDTDGDGRADIKEIILHGFGTEDVHHSISAHTWGPDGALYMHMGTFLHTQVETPYGPVRGAYGETYRYEPRTMKLEPYVSYPYANPWGNVFMKDGTHLIGDVSTGMNYFAPPLTVATDYPKKHIEMKDFLTSKIRPKTCGMEIISSRQFPDNVQGDVLFNTFVGFQGIKQHSISEEGSGITGHEKEPLLQSTDPNFRPVDLQFGPDGALYVVDWFNAIINHGERALRDPRRDHSHGRIWRITSTNNKQLPSMDLSRLGINDLLDQLKVYEDRVRYRTRMRLSDLPETMVLPAVDTWVSRLNPHDSLYDQNKLEALWVHQQFNRPNEKLLDELLTSRNYHVRAAATRVLYYWNDRVKNAQEKLIAMSADSSARVRLEAIVALSHFKTEATVHALLAATSYPADDYIDYALQESFKHLKPVWMQMFKKDPNFLKTDPAKAGYLLRPLSSAGALALPGFLAGDPDKGIYVRDPLSTEEWRSISGAPAVANFLAKQQQTIPSSVTTEVARKGTTVIKIAVVPGKMTFDKAEITITAGSTVSVIFENPDAMLHNLVIIKPGSYEKVGNAADAMASLKDGAEQNFVPTVPEVLFATPLVAAGKKYELNFKAPATPGDYPFVCTFPGHWRVMKGVLKVVKS